MPGACKVLGSILSTKKKSKHTKIGVSAAELVRAFDLLIFIPTSLVCRPKGLKELRLTVPFPDGEIEAWRGFYERVFWIGQLLIAEPLAPCATAHFPRAPLPAPV